MSDKKPKVGLALGGGGARGLAHIGVLKFLRAKGVKIDMVAGVSMGAFMAAYYSLGLDLDKLEKEAVSFTKTKAIRKLMDLAPSGRAILKGQKAQKFIAELLGGNRDFKEAKIPLTIVATNLSDGREVILKKGSINQAILASISVPGIFPPVEINNNYLIDGGVVNPTPVDAVKKMGADIVIGVDLIMKRDVRIKEPNLVVTLLSAYEIIRTQVIKYNLAKMGPGVALIKPKNMGAIDSFRFYDIAKFIKAGEEAAEEAWPKIEKLVG